MGETQQQEWLGKTEGSTWMHRSLIASLRFMPLWFVYLGMAVLVIPFFLLFAHKGYISMYRFFRKRLGYNWLKSFCYTYKNHVRFGQIIIDKFAAYAGKKFEFDLRGYDHFQALASQDGGFMILSSHVGNYELAGYSLVSDRKRFNALVFSGEKETVMSNRNRMLNANNIRLIPVKEDMSHLFILNNSLADGEIVSIPGDRIFGSPRSVECEFLGATARFPLGPFMLAAQRNVPILVVFVMKESMKKYATYVLPLKYEGATVKEKAASAAHCFAKMLEETVLKYPTQWFNYYDFWKQ